MPCSWQKEDYFALLMSGDKRSFTALELLVDDLHADKEKTVNIFLRHSGSEDFLWGLVKLLGNDTARVAGNAAYILGTLAESESGCMRVLSLAKAGSPESRKILQDLTRMLTFDDSESVMNAAGTMGTLAESHEGREWMLNERCLPKTLEHVTTLLHSDNLWTASNAALVLARLSISELGCARVLEHEYSQHILSKLILSLGIDEAGRGMNAAFAIGRLCDLDQGRKRLLQLNDSERMISSLAKMLSCSDTGASKNACFALSCLATNSEGHSRLLSNIHSDDILKTLATLLNAEDSETGWFAAMTLRTLASQPKGCLRLREHPQIIPSLKAVETKTELNVDLREEAIVTLEILKRLPKPSQPVLEVVFSDTVKASWEPVITKSGFQVRYQLFDGIKCVYTGKDNFCTITGLQPSTIFVYKVRAYTEGDESPFSETTSIQTEESVPDDPQNVRVLGATITQLKIGWDPPENSNGTLKGYHVFLGDKEMNHVTETNVILTGLTANTTYEIYVCAATAKGRGEKACVIGTTSEIGAHAPGKPHVNVIGRNELYVSWSPPEVPLGRFNRYDVIMNDKIIYSGNDLNLPVRRLIPDTEYCFVVVALTSEGKFESKASKKRTSKDEYDTARPPLYQTPKKETIDEGAKTPTKRKKSAHRIPSAKLVAKPRAGTAKERSKSNQKQNPDQRPPSATSSITSSHEMSLDMRESARIDQIRPEPVPAISKVKHQPTSSPEPFTQENNSPSPIRPIAVIKDDVPRSIPKPKTPRTMNRLERSYTSSKIQPNHQVLLSTVSMQNNNKKTDNGEDIKSNEGRASAKKVSDKPDKESANFSNSSRIERSKSLLSSRDIRKGRNSMPSSRVGSETKLPSESVDTVRHSADRFRDSDRLTKSMDKTKHLAVSIDKENKGFNSTSRESSSRIHDMRSEAQFASSAADRERMTTSSRDKSRYREKNNSKDAVLPKPLPPSQKYLEGTVASTTADNPWGKKTAHSPRSSKDSQMIDSHDSDWLTQVKSVSEQLSRPFPPPNLTVPHSADSTYYIDSAHFLQRANTYINSHRKHILPSLNTKGDKPSLDSLQTPLPSIKSEPKHSSERRPVGRRSLEKLQKSKMKATVPGPNQPFNSFDADIPESNVSKLGNKFIPMQLRTQPANLGMGSLQRVNTTLLGDISDNSVSFKRLEALTRSQTQLELRSQQSQAAAHLPAETRRDLGLIMHKDKDRNPSSRKAASGSGQKVSKLGGSSQHHQRHKEPDSMYLQQSWGALNSSQDLGALQNVR